MQVTKHTRSLVAIVAALLMVTSPLGPVLESGFVGTASANQNTIGSAVELRLTVEDPEPGVTTTHAWRDYPTTSTSTSQVMINYSSGIDVSNVGTDDIKRVGLDTGGDGKIDTSITVSSIDISDSGSTITFNLDSSYNVSESSQFIVVYGDVTHPDSTGASASIGMGSSTWRSGISLGLTTPTTSLPETHSGSEPYATGMLPGDATPGETTSYSYVAGPASDGSNATVNKIRYKLPSGSSINTVNSSNVDVFGVDTDGDGSVEEQLTVSSVSSTTWASGPELHITPSSSVTLEPGEQIIAVYSGITNPGTAGTYDWYTSYNDYVGFGSGTMQISSTYTITGTATDANGDAVSGATVDIDRQWTNRYDVTEVTTDSSGQYTVTVPATGNYTIETTADGYTSSAQTVSVSGDTTVDTSLQTASYTYDATVQDSSGSAIGGATVELIDSSGSVVSSATTASDGTVSLSAPSGSYDVEVHTDGYDTATGTADLSTSGDSGTYSLAISTYTVDGTVTDASGNAKEGVTVTLLDSSGSTVAETSTDSTGAYSVSGVKHATGYTVEASLTGYTGATKTVDVTSATTVDLTIEQADYTYNATVLDADDEGVKGATVELISDSGAVVSSGTTDSNGSISVSAPSGTYDVEVSGDHIQTATGTADLSSSDASGEFTATYDVTQTLGRPAESTPGVVYAEFDEAANVTVTVEAYDSEAGEWVTVQDAKDYSVNGTADQKDVIEVSLDDYTASKFDKYRVTTVGDAQPAATGVAEQTGIGGIIGGGSGGIPFVVVVVGLGLLLTGAAAVVAEE